MEKPKVTCELCGKQYTNTYVLASHQKIVHERKNDSHQCEICKNKFATKYKLTRHIQGKVFSNQSNVKHNLMIVVNIVGVHSNIRDFHCAHCGRSFKTRDVALKHQRTHGDKGPFKCSICNEEFKFKSGLDYHQKTKHKNIKSQSTDEVIVESVEEFLNYEEIQETDNENDVRSPTEIQTETDNTFEYIEEELSLENKTDNQELNYENDIISDVKLLQQIDESIVIVERIETILESDESSKKITKFLSCEEIQLETIHDVQDNDDLFNELIDDEEAREEEISFEHEMNNQEFLIETNEISIKSHICDLCGTTYKSKSNLNRHMNRTHFKESHKYACEFCGKKFLLDFYLKRHLITHNNERNFACSICEKKFKTSESLRCHIQLLHSNIPRGEKSFKCEICDRKYFYKRHLTYHMRKHSGENKYKCEECDKGFHYSEAVVWHKIRVHGEKAPYNCKECSKKFLHQNALNKHEEEHLKQIK